MKKIIYSLSIFIPIAVALLTQIKIEGFDFQFLPSIYAGINAATALFLIAALIAIKNKKIIIHQRLIQISLFLSLIFLICYILYHATTAPTSYGGVSPKIYYFILISHIIGSIFVIPLVLFSYLYGQTKNYAQHKKIVRYAFPLWLYVAITGVIVYQMIAPFYQ